MCKKLLLHLVFGGKISDPSSSEFLNTKELDIVGIFPTYTEAVKAWRGASQLHVDDAYCKYVIVTLHKDFYTK